MRKLLAGHAGIEQHQSEKPHPLRCQKTGGKVALFQREKHEIEKKKGEREQRHRIACAGAATDDGRTFRIAPRRNHQTLGGVNPRGCHERNRREDRGGKQHREGSRKACSADQEIAGEQGQIHSRNPGGDACQAIVANRPGHGRRHRQKVHGQHHRLRLLEGAGRGPERDKRRCEQQGSRKDHEAARQGVAPRHVEDEGLRGQAEDLEQCDRHRRQVQQAGESRKRGHGKHLAQHQVHPSDGCTKDGFQGATFTFARGDVDGGIERP